MISLAEGARRWLGDRDRAPRRAMLFGAGFTRSAMREAPLFWDAAEAVRSFLHRERCPAIPAHLAATFGQQVKDDEITDLIEMSDLLLRDRGELVPALLAEPAIEGMRLHPPSSGPVPASSRIRGERAYRLLRGWRRLLATSCPTHLEALAPGGPPLIVGRLVLEGVVDELLSTNWDALIELGCMLVGVRVRDVSDRGRDDLEPTWLRNLPTKLTVFEAGDEATRHPRMRGEVALRKLHGGIRGIEAALRTPGPDPVLRRNFLVTSSELVRWDMTSRWVEDAVGDTLRTHAVMLVGVSGGDPVVYHAFRRRISEWESAGGTAEPLPLVALNYAPSLRLRNLVSHRVQGDGGPSVQQPVVKGDARIGIRGVFARWLGEHLASELPKELGAVLLGAIDSELNSSEGPLVQLLVDALHPNARWAAIAEGRAPFSGPTPSAPFRRWWLAPWGLEHRQADPGHLRTIAAFCMALWRGWGDGDKVDPWSGVVHLRAAHPVVKCLAELTAVAPGPITLLPLPWPWPIRAGALSPRLSAALRLEMDWAAGGPLPSLAQAPLWLVSLPHQEMPTRIIQPVAGARARWLPGATNILHQLWMELADA